jgi:16S rRNA (cytidine1402-2'-O)-methyltransferase
LNKRTEVKEHQDFIKPLLEGKNIGLMSEAGCPGVADPGAVIVKLAHEKGIQVVFSRSFFDFCHDGIWNERPSFTHVIYPLKKGEKSSPKKSRENFAGKNQSQIFIETPP